MENWVIYWLLSWTLFWVANFYLKIVAEKWISKVRVSLYSVIVETLLAWCYLLYLGEYQSFGVLLWILIVIRIIAAIEKNLLKIESLKYIETNVFFPLHSSIQIFAWFIIGMIFFREYLTLIQWCGVVLWIIMIYLLASWEKWNGSANFKKGILLLLAANAVLLVSSSINKYVAHIDFDIWTYVFISTLVGSLYLLWSRKEIYAQHKREQCNTEIKIGVVKWILTIVGFTFLLLALKEWPFALVQVIHTSSILIPIILSTILYHEKMTIQKGVALLLFVVVVYLMSV